MPHASAAWLPTVSFGSTAEALRKQTREERSIYVPEGTAEVVVGGPKLYGTLRRDVFKRLWRIDRVDFVQSES